MASSPRRAWRTGTICGAKHIRRFPGMRDVAKIGEIGPFGRASARATQGRTQMIQIFYVFVGIVVGAFLVIWQALAQIMAGF